MILVDDHLLLRVLAGAAPPALANEPIATTSGWWRRALSPVAATRSVKGIHSRFAAALTEAEAGALWEALCVVGQPGSLVAIPEPVELGPAMAWLARYEGLNRLAAEAVAAALDRSAAVWVHVGNDGRLTDMADRYGFDLVMAP